MLGRFDIQSRGRFHAGHLTNFWLKLSWRYHRLQEEQRDKNLSLESCMNALTKDCKADSSEKAGVVISKA